jgi:hypothetical protein
MHVLVAHLEASTRLKHRLELLKRDLPIAVRVVLVKDRLRLFDGDGFASFGECFFELFNINETVARRVHRLVKVLGQLLVRDRPTLAPVADWHRGDFGQGLRSSQVQFARTLTK